MDIEFHYYVTFIAALKAGFKAQDAYVISYACQHTDDNMETYLIGKGTGDEYCNYISQTNNILKPQKDLMRIYPVFHFLPGSIEEIEGCTARRKDGKFHILNTIPDNGNARTVFDAALQTRDPYRIGIAAHVYADTFAHQNFVGYYESVNSMTEPLDKIIPNVGHAEAQHRPDLPGLIWEDVRLIRKISMIDNKERFLQAAEALFAKFRMYVDPGCPEQTVALDKSSLRSELDKAIGDPDKNNENRGQRIARYKEIIGSAFREYEEDRWFNDAVIREWLLPFIKPLAKYEWKANYKNGDWFKFQEAVKAHQWFTMDNILNPMTVDLEMQRFGAY